MFEAFFLSIYWSYPIHCIISV